MMRSPWGKALYSSRLLELRKTHSLWTAHACGGAFSTAARATKTVNTLKILMRQFAEEKEDGQLRLASRRRILA